MKNGTIMSDENKINDGHTKVYPPAGGGDLDGVGTFPGEVHQPPVAEF